MSRDIEYEVIVVANGARQEIKDSIRSKTDGVRLIETDANLGFAGGCNLGASAAGGEYLVFLNDDAVVAPGWLDWLIATAEAHPRAGAVGSLVLFPDNTVQEAGMVIWSDGTAKPIGRGEPVAASTWNFVRKVDYASASSLLVKRAAWEQVGGFDPEYHPAYYEDVDFSLALRSAGWEVWFDPRSRVWHHESASSDTDFRRFLFERNEMRLRAKWAHELALQERAAPESPAATARAIWRAQGTPTRVLALFDRIPEPSLDSLCDALLDIADAGLGVTFLPMRIAGEHVPHELASAGIAVSKESLESHLAPSWRHYDVVIVSGSDNFERAVALVRRRQPQAILIYHCETLSSQRMLEKAPFVVDELERVALERTAADLRRVEEQIVEKSDIAVTLSREDADLLRSVAGECRIETIVSSEPVIALGEAGFHERQGLAHVAEWTASTCSANADGLRWFVAEVLPWVRDEIPWVRLQVAGARVPEELLDLADSNVRFVGHVADLDNFYVAHRVIIVPARFGPGVKRATMRAVRHGVPVVCTSCGTQGIDVEGMAALEVADDPKAFARSVIRMLTDPQRWLAARNTVRALAQPTVQPRDAVSWRDVIERALANRLRESDRLLDGR